MLPGLAGFMITEDFRAWGVASQVPNLPVSESRQLIIEWTAQA